MKPLRVICSLQALALLLVSAAGCSEQRSRPVEAGGGASTNREGSRLRVEESPETALVRVKKALDEYMRSMGAQPANLNDLVSRGFLSELPKLPPGLAFYYQPTNFNVFLATEAPSSSRTEPAPPP